MRTVPSAFGTALCVVLLAAAACASAPRTADEESTGPPQPVTLYVQNNHWSDVTIWVLAGGQRNRLGTVTAARTAEFVLRPAMLSHRGEVRFAARALAGMGPVTTDLVVLRSGSVVEWTLESSLNRSSLSVY